MILLSNNLVFSRAEKLVLWAFTGLIEREWVLNTSISFMTSMGGVSKKEVLLLGLSNGGVYRVNIDNPFPVLILEHSVKILQLDINKTKDKLAIVDSNKNLTVWHLQTKKQLYSEMNI